MTHYIYSGYLRRKAREILARHSQSLAIAVVGERGRERALFAKIAAATLVESLDSLDAEGIRRLASSDAILCRFDDLARLRTIFASPDTVDDRVKVLAVRGSVDTLDADAFDHMMECCTRLNLELVSHQAAYLEFQREKEMAFIFARHPDAMRSLDFLKAAVVLEAHCLHAAAIDLVQRYNELAARDEFKIDEALIDRTYEVEAYMSGETTSQLRLLATRKPAAEATVERADASSAPRTASKVDDRRLSIHFDLLHRPDGEAQLHRVAHSLVTPDKVEIIARVPHLTVPPSLPDLTKAIIDLGISVKVFQDPTGCDLANPCAPAFLTMTAPEARLAVYYGAERVPASAGWDHELLRIADGIEGPVFLLKSSEHKTRYYAEPEDAWLAPEGFPAVSRAWLETCGAWSREGVSVGMFQTLVAFYFGCSDWANKHRLLRLFPVMNLQTEPLGDAGEPRPAATLQGLRRSPEFRSAERAAIRIALTLQLREWARRAGVQRPQFDYDPPSGAVALREGAGLTMVKSWSVKPFRARTPL